MRVFTESRGYCEGCWVSKAGRAKTRIRGSGAEELLTAVTVESKLLELAAISVLYFLARRVYSWLATTACETWRLVAMGTPSSWGEEGMLAIASV